MNQTHHVEQKVGTNGTCTPTRHYGGPIEESSASPTSGIKPIINPPRKLKKDRGEAEGSGPTTEHRSSRFSASCSMVSVAYLTDFERANNTLYNDWVFAEEQTRSDLAANLWPPPFLPLREYSIKPPWVPISRATLNSIKSCRGRNPARMLGKLRLHISSMKASVISYLTQAS